ncbi:hypothetical protein LIER_09971 [Lithospermum erythrorhizon]|uniref:Secreted protein n=1 Tax=Lithospermum erythrorhizon TaxID=34254 RepID=A0AAV3PJA5_LITER
MSPEIMLLYLFLPVLLSVQLVYPNGHIVVATMEGHVALPFWYLNRHDQHIRLHDHSLCAIHDQRSGILIGAGELHEGLYYFRRISTVCTVTVPTTSCFELWDCCLGHPLDRVLMLVPEIKATTTKSSLG